MTKKKYIAYICLVVALSFVPSALRAQLLGTPTLQSPQNNAADLPTSITFIWNSVGAATSYEIQIADNANFSNPVFDESPSGTSATASNLSNGATYYWRVRAFSLVLTSSWSEVWTFTTASIVTPPPAPKLVLPADGSQNIPTDMTFSWNPTSGATAYALQVSTDAGFGHIVLNDDAIGGTSRAFTGLANSTTYYWRVQGENSAGKGGWSDVWSFTTSPPPAPTAPALVSPANGAMSQPSSLTLSWSAVSTASRYWFELALDSVFTNIQLSDSMLSVTSRQVSGLAKGVTYYWRVSALNAGGAGAWSSIWEFLTAPALNPPAVPALLSPVNGSKDLGIPVDVHWSPSASATSYDLQVAADSGFGVLSLNDSAIATASQSVAGLDSGRVYYWRVRAGNAVGASGWSPTWQFATAVRLTPPPVPSLLSPPDNASAVHAGDTLRWSSPSGPLTYWLQISTGASFAAMLVNDSTVTRPFALVQNLADGSRLYWRVGALDSVGFSGWSPIRSFTTETANLSAPVLLAPEDGAVEQTQTIKCIWQRARSAIAYDIEVAKDTGFSAVVFRSDTLSDTVCVIGPFGQGGTYYWRTRGRSAASGWSPFSARRSFNVQLNHVSPGTVEATLSVSFPSYTNASAFHPADYRLIGLPGSSIMPISELFAGSPGTNWQVYWDNGAPSDYLIRYNPGDTVFHFSQGRAFWAIKDGSLVVDTIMQAAVLDSAGAAEIPLHSGWNIITNPFADTVTWSSVQSYNQVLDPIYGYNGTFLVAPDLLPGIGYYYFNAGGAPRIAIPSTAPQSGAHAAGLSKTTSDSSWFTMLRVDADGMTDSSAWCGVSTAAHNGFNRFDVHKPAGLHSSPAIYFDHPEWDSLYTTFADEIHPLISTSSEWAFTVNCTRYHEAHVSIPGIRSVPAEFGVMLLDPVSNSWIDMRRNPRYAFTPVTTTTVFRLLIGKKDAIGEITHAPRISSITIGPNFPNPFNPTTAIPVELPADTEIRVSVFNILGEKIADIIDGRVAAGKHLFFWNGTDARGQSVSSGVYLYQLRTSAGRVVTRKMVLMK